VPVAPSILAGVPNLQCKPPCHSLRNSWPSSQGADLEQAVKDYTAIRSHTPDTEAARSIRDLLYEVLGMDVTMGTPCPPGNPMQLQEDQQILLTREEGGRLAFVQMVDS
jgi:hypothetical protein